jgi:hypothetical protein
VAEYLTIGDVNVHELPEVAMLVKYKSKRKIDEKVADGASDATATDKGREVRDITIKLSWPDLPRLNFIMGPILKTLEPGGPDGGKPFDYAHEREGLDLGDIKAVRAILIKEAEGPNVDEGTRIAVIEYSCDSWAQPSAQAPAGKTPDNKDKQNSEPGQSNGSAPASPGQNYVQAPTVDP